MPRGGSGDDSIETFEGDIVISKEFCSFLHGVVGSTFSLWWSVLFQPRGPTVHHCSNQFEGCGGLGLSC